VPVHEPGFVGEGRGEMVRLLGGMFDRVAEVEQPVWVQLVAGSGWGKTRVARELYRWLAAERQQQPAYWPADVLVEGMVDVVEVRRKRVTPGAFDHVPGSLPSWFW